MKKKKDNNTMARERLTPVADLINEYNRYKTPTKGKIRARNELILNYKKTAEKIAEGISNSTNLDIEELISIGYVMLAGYFKDHKYLGQHLSTNIYNTIFHGLRNYAVDTILENLATEPLRQLDIRTQRDYGEIDPISEQISLDFSKLDEKIREEMGKNRRKVSEAEKDYLVFFLHSPIYTPFYGKERTLEEIGNDEKLKVSRSMVQIRYTQAKEKALKAIKKFLGVRLRYLDIYDFSYSSGFWGTDISYRPELADIIDRELRQKQGIGLASLSTSLRFNPVELSSFVNRALGGAKGTVYLDNDQKKRLFESYGRIDEHMTQS